jgi:hypothetical protein
VARLSVVRNNAEWHVVQRPGRDCAYALDDLPRPVDGADWYYVRAVQEDGHMAWSSPVWVEAAR